MNSLIAALGTAFAAPQVKPDFLFVARTHPAGAAVIGSALADMGNFDAGGSAGLYYYWYELSAVARYTVMGGFVIGTVWGGWEPGWFIPDERIGGTRGWSVREWGPRPLGRARLEVNLRNERAWVYARATGLARQHAFPEWDPFRDHVFEGLERSGEASLALMGCPARQGTRAVWVYAEVGAEEELDLGAIDRVARGGVIAEELRPGLTADLDFYYSFMDGVLGGPGVLAVVFWTPKP